MASNGTEVYIKLPTGRSSRYDTYPSQRLSELCAKVAAEEGVKTTQVNLKYQGKRLDPNKTIGEYGVRVETILKAEILFPQSLDIVIRFEDERPPDELVISNLEPVTQLFNEISTKSEIPASRLLVKIEGRVLPNSPSRLMDVGIARGSTLLIGIKPEEARKSETAKAENDVPMDESERQNVMSSFDARGKPVEVAFSFDTTGSMYSYLRQVRTKLRECCSRLIQDIPNIRISIIAQGDYCDSQDAYAVSVLDLCSDVQTLVEFSNDVPSTCGGDSPECYELVLKRAQTLDWSETSAKALVVIGDYYPHPPSYTDQNISWRDELQLLTGLGVKVYGVQAGDVSSATHFYRELASVSGGCHLSLSHMDVITDMFLAVCYNEGENEMLENFEQELVEAGNMTEQKQEMFNQLKENVHAKESPSTQITRNDRVSLREAWWDFSLDTSTSPKYRYDAETDKWFPISDSRPTPSPNPNPIRAVIDNVPGRRARSAGSLKRKSRCTIM